MCESVCECVCGYVCECAESIPSVCERDKSILSVHDESPVCDKSILSVSVTRAS